MKESSPTFPDENIWLVRSKSIPPEIKIGSLRSATVSFEKISSAVFASPQLINHEADWKKEVFNSLKNQEFLLFFPRVLYQGRTHRAFVQLPTVESFTALEFWGAEVISVNLNFYFLVGLAEKNR